MRVFRWGDDLAVQLPQELVDRLGLKEGDELNVVAAKGGTAEAATDEEERQHALDRIAGRNWASPEDTKFNRDEANER